MEAINEKILNLWLDIASIINNQRLVSYLSFNEAHICNRLWRQLGQEKDYLTQNELCNETGIEKASVSYTHLDVYKRQDELWVGVKCQSNREIAGSPRNSFRASLR